MALEPRGLYVHVGFCSSFCAYCDFASELRSDDGVARYLKAIETELSLVAGDGLRPKTVYFGGGTPSVLAPAEIEALFDILRHRVAFGGVEEMTFECNPDSASPEKLRLLRSLGATRVSMGAQSFGQRLLKVLGRRHSADAVRSAFAGARAAGFADLSVDLIYGVPTQTAEDFDLDLESALALGPDHVSAYGLTLEDGTPLADSVRRGELAPAPEEAQGAMYARACERLDAAGLEQYEISNFARPGRECRHNCAYWRREEYVGLGPSAASFVGGERRKNAEDLDEYCRALAEGRMPVVESERLDGERAAREELVLRLRMCEGVDLDDLRGRTGLDVRAVHGERIRRWRELGLLRLDGARLRLTPDGFRVSNSILSELV